MAQTRKANTSSSLLQRFMAAAAWAAVLLLWVGAASVYVNPSWCSYIVVLGMGFPFLLAGTLLMLFLCLLFAPRQAWIPLVGVLACFGSVRAYFPINFSKKAPDSCLSLITYNVHGWGDAKNWDADTNRTAAYLADREADIICLQEAYCADKVMQKIRTTLNRNRKMYFDSVRLSENRLVCFSVFPIVGKEKICGTGMNGAAVFKLLQAPGDTLLVVNCHLQTMGLSGKERSNYKDMVQRNPDIDVDATSRRLVSKIAKAGKLRSRQAEAVADYVKRNAGRPVVVCGDFNDTPISYTWYTIGRDLQDAYRASGTGLGRTFNRDAMFVRIDHIFCSDHWEVFEARVDDSVYLSDHHPVHCKLLRKE